MGLPLLRLAAVGDLQLGDSPTCVGFGFASRVRPDELTDALVGLKSVLGDADLVFGNLEVPLSAAGPDRRGWRDRQLRGHPGFAESLRAAGFNVLNVANNHAAQHGVDSFRTTVELLRTAGITTCGLRGTSPWSSSPATIWVRSSLVGFLGYCLRPRQYSDEVPPYAEATLDEIVADVRRLRSESDVVVVSLHWGEEFVPLPSTPERAFARAVADAGASIVLGHHPHVVRSVETYGRSLIAYSLGNCIGDMVWYAPFRKGAVLTATLDRTSVRDAVVLGTELSSSYRPRLTGTRILPVSSERLPTLDPPEYARAIRRTWAEQRIALYWYTLLRVWRFPPRILLQLATRTVLNKLNAIFRAAPSNPPRVT